MIATSTSLMLAEESLGLGPRYPRVNINLAGGASGVSLVAKAPRWLLRLASGTLKLALPPLSVSFDNRPDRLSYLGRLNVVLLHRDLRMS